MMEKMIALQQKRRSKKGGFTLVELIVVLVILAILAALLIPALTGYIDKAKEKSLVAETRQVVMAAQTLYDESYGTIKQGAKAPTFGDTAANATSTVGPVIAKKDVADLAEVTPANITTITAGTDNKINKVEYTRNGKTCTYDGSTYKVDKAK